jgi:hypothetical protein
MSGMSRKFGRQDPIQGVTKSNTQSPPFKKSYLIMKRVPISQVIPNPTNPRIIKDDKFKKLVKSIEEFPQMLELRPIVVDSNMVVLGGNMRLKACLAAGLKEVPIIVADQLTDAQKGEFIIKDNVGFGEWDWDLLANEWEPDALINWGLELPTSWGNEDIIMDSKDVDSGQLMAIVIVAYENVEDLDKITSLYELNSTDITESIKGQIGTQRKMYVFKK